MKKTVLLTGAFGNIGCFVLDALVAQGYRVIAFDKPGTPAQKAASAHAHPAVEVVWSDINNREAVADAVSRVDAVIHLAALIPPFSESHPELTQAVNVDATRQLIEVMEELPGARRLIFASSTAVFGRTQDREPPLLATDEPAPDDHYGKSKLDCETLIRASNLQWSILRIAACPALNRTPSIRGLAVFDNHPDGRIELIHPVDAGLAFANAVGCEAATGKVLYIGGGGSNRMTIHEMFNMLFMALGFNPLPREAFRVTRRVKCYGEWVDTTESQELLEFQRHEAQAVFSDLRDSLGLFRYLFVVVRMFRTLATAMLLRTSPYYRQQSS